MSSMMWEKQVLSNVPYSQLYDQQFPFRHVRLLFVLLIFPLKLLLFFVASSTFVSLPSIDHTTMFIKSNMVPS